MTLKSNFLSAMNTKFEATLENGKKISLELIDIKEGKATSANKHLESFLAFFKTPKQNHFLSLNGVFSNAILGKQMMMLTPMTPEDDDIIYQAVFSYDTRLVEEQP